MFGIRDLPLFIAAGLLLNATPGADTLYILRCAATDGFRGGALAALGISAGCFVHIVAAALGISALLLASRTAFTAIRFAGAIHLICSDGHCCAPGRSRRAASSRHRRRARMR